MSEVKNKSEHQNNSATPVQAPKEASSLGETEYLDSRASTFQFIQLQAAADDKGKGNRITQLQSKSTQFTSFSRLAQLQAKRDSQMPSPHPHVVQREENKTGLPDGLKSGMESISGLSLDDVKVYRNSDKPAQLQAYAYAQGTNIHLGPGQEKHLPHELGHVVQQKQGRVKATTQLKGTVSINDNDGLEKEADVLGAKAENFEFNPSTTAQLKSNKTTSSKVIQRGIISNIANFFKDRSATSHKQFTDESDDKLEGPASASAQKETEPSEQKETVVIPPFSYKGNKVVIDLFGQKVEIGADLGAETTLPKKQYNIEINPLDLGLDFPVFPGIFVTLGLEVKPKLDFALDGGIVKFSEGVLSINNATMKGTFALGVKASVKTMLGVPKLANLKAGIYGNLQGVSELRGELNASADFTQKTMQGLLTASAIASLKGEGGISVDGEIMTKKVKKEIPLFTRELYRLRYEKSVGINVSQKGEEWAPRLQDFETIIKSEDYNTLNPKTPEDYDGYLKDLENKSLLSSPEEVGSEEEGQTAGAKSMGKKRGLFG